MKKYSINYKTGKRYKQRISSGILVKEFEDDILVHTKSHNTIEAIRFDTNDKSGKIYTRRSGAKKIDVLGFREWSSNNEIIVKLVTKKDTSRGYIQYDFIFHGCIELKYSIVDDTDDVILNFDNKKIRLLLNDGKVGVKYAHKDIKYDIKRNSNKLYTNHPIINIALSESFDIFSINGNRYLAHIIENILS